MKPRFNNHYWGCMFKKFYGEPVWNDYFTKMIERTKKVTERNFRFSSAATISNLDVEWSFEQSAGREFFLLLDSENVYHWLATCEVTPETAFSDYDIDCLPYTNGPMITVDVKAVGCKYTLENLREQLSAENPVEAKDNEFLEHCWVLSNSCGQVVNPLNVKRFKHLTFGENATVPEEPTVGSSLSDYLSHCMTVLERSKLPSCAGETKMKDDWLGYCVKYLATTDLGYNRKEDNPLLTALLYELIETHHIYVSSYAKNIKNFAFFIDSALPTIDLIWDFRWLQRPRDHRLLFEFSMSDASDAVNPSLSLNDLTVVLSSKLVLLEKMIHDSNIVMLKGIVGAILMEDNPDLDEGLLWICFHCYYGEYRTASTRIVPRPQVYTPPFQLTFSKVVMTGVEGFFTQLQNKNPNVNIRRQFCGRFALEAFSIFKRLGLAFPQLASVNVPPELGYLNVDYYKWVDTSKLTEKEVSVLTTIHKRVDRMCVDRLVNTRRAPALRAPKYEICNGNLRKTRKFKQDGRPGHVEKWRSNATHGSNKVDGSHSRKHGESFF
nr:P60 [Carrot closterovirus 3]